MSITRQEISELDRLREANRILRDAVDYARKHFNHLTQTANGRETRRAEMQSALDAADALTRGGAKS